MGHRALMAVGLAALVAWTASGSLGFAQSTAAGLRYDVIGERSEARYRIRERLVGITFPNDAVGSTSAIQGGVSLDADGRVVSAESRFVIDVRTLRSDEPRRDNYVRRNTLGTEQYPTVVFVPTEIRGLRAPGPEGSGASLQIVGDLTVREVTRRVAWEATVVFEGRDVRIQARTAFHFDDFELRVPRVSVVLSVDDTIRLEADVRLRRRG